MTFPSTYKPKTPNDFIGPARTVALSIDRLLAGTLPQGTALKVLILGKPALVKPNSPITSWLD